MNFHNSLDFALATGTTLGLETNWEANQEDFKPDKAPLNTWYYNYNPNDPILDQRVYINWSAGGAPFSMDHHEVMSFVARPRSKAVGAEGATSGSIGGSVILRDSQYGFTGADYDHSGQFNRRIQELEAFYRTLSIRLGVAPTQ